MKFEIFIALVIVILLILLLTVTGCSYRPMELHTDKAEVKIQVLDRDGMFLTMPSTDHRIEQ